MREKGGRNPYRRRIELLISLWDNLISRPPGSREELVEMLRDAYDKARLEPLRGKAKPPDLYDKELASLYVVGKYGLGLHEEYAEIFDKYFYKEELYEELGDSILESREEDAKRIVEEKLGGLDQNTLARMLRVYFTRQIFGLLGEDEFLSLLRRIPQVFPEHAETVKKYSRFYVAFRVAEAIARGQVRSRTSKEALKQALSVKIGVDKSTPDDEYIASIARDVFRVPGRLLGQVLSAKPRRQAREAS